MNDVGAGHDDLESAVCELLERDAGIAEHRFERDGGGPADVDGRELEPINRSLRQPGPASEISLTPTENSSCRSDLGGKPVPIRVHRPRQLCRTVPG